MPSVSPRFTSKLTPFTACTVRSGVLNVTLRSLTCNRPALSEVEGSAISGRLRVTGAAHPHVAGHRLRGRLGQQRFDAGANVLGKRAAGAEAPARGGIDRVGRIALARPLLFPLPPIPL